MVLTFTEEQAIEIRKTGLSVVQFKYFIKNGVGTTTRILNDIKSAFEKLINVFVRIRDAFGNIIHLIEKSQDRLECIPSTRYKFVKALGNIRYRKYGVLSSICRCVARSNC